MHDTLLSLQREIESKMCLTGRQRKLWFLSKKRKNVSDWICFISDRRPLMSLCLFFSNNEGWIFWPSPTPVSMRILVYVYACLLFTAQHTMQQHWILTWGFTDRIVCSHGLVVRALWLILFSQQASAAPQEQKPAKISLSRALWAFLQSCRSTRACLSQSNGYSLRFCVSMGSWMFCQCIWVKAETVFRALGETDGVARKDAAPICLKYLAALIHFD